MKTRLQEKPHIVFLILGILFGGLTVFITPPFQVPDEDNHFYRILQISSGRIFSEIVPGNVQGGKVAGGYLPESAGKMAHALKNDFQSGPAGKRTLENILQYTDWYPKSEPVKYILFPNTALYSPTLYFPQVIGVWTGRLLNTSWLGMVYLGRLAALLFWLGCVYFSVRFLPSGKWLLIFLALSPMSLFEAASLSADSVIIGSCFLYSALWLKVAAEQDIGYRAIIVISLIGGLFIALSKPVYLPLIFLSALLPFREMPRWKLFWALIGSFALPLAVFFWWSFANREVFDINAVLYSQVYGATHPGSIISPSEQTRFIFSHLWAAAVVLLRTWLDYGVVYLKMFIGVLGWLDTWLPDGLIYSYFALLIGLSVFDNPDKIRLPALLKIGLFLIWLAIMGLLHLAMYLSASPVGSEHIEGIQGRYFIPAALLIFMVFNNSRVSLRKGSLLLLTITLMPVYLISMLWILAQHYYL